MHQLGLTFSWGALRIRDQTYGLCSGRRDPQFKWPNPTHFNKIRPTFRKPDPNICTHTKYQFTVMLYKQYCQQTSACTYKSKHEMWKLVLCHVLQDCWTIPLSLVLKRVVHTQSYILHVGLLYCRLHNVAVFVVIRPITRPSVGDRVKCCTKSVRLSRAFNLLEIGEP